MTSLACSVVILFDFIINSSKNILNKMSEQFLNVYLLQILHRFLKTFCKHTGYKKKKILNCFKNSQGFLVTRKVTIRKNFCLGGWVVCSRRVGVKIYCLKFRNRKAVYTVECEVKNTT